MSQRRILVVDDDPRLLHIVEMYLGIEGYEVRTASNGEEGLREVDAQRPDLIILDIMMPGMDGLSLCRLMRQTTPVPILMLTARDGVPDRVAGLEAGADDYLVKPFDLEELVARLRALLRRTADGSRKELLSFGDLTLDRRQWTAQRGDEALSLTATEFRLLELLMRFPGRVFSREDILTALWGPEWLGVESNVVDVHVANLREKLEAGGRSRIIKTVRGVGYTLESE